MHYVLNLAYLLLIVVASPVLLHAAVRKGKYRQGWGAKVLGAVPRRSGNAPCLWFHAVSVGEVNLLKPLLDLIGKRLPGCQCVISTTTKTGYELARTKYHQQTVFYCPIDFSWAVRRAMRRIRPDVLVLAELEIWPNLIWAAKRQGARVVVVNGRLSENSFRGYRRCRWLISSTLRSIDLIAAQNVQYGERFRHLGIPEGRVHVTGSLKFDGAQTDRRNPLTQELRQRAGIMPEDVVLLAGSTQSPEEAMATDVFKQLSREHPNLRLIVVPRHPERFAEVAQLLEESGVRWQRRGRLDTEGADPGARVLLVDTVGELGAWWGTADLAFVGGSMGSRGGQNMIEPAAYGAAVSFGPQTRNFRDVVSLMLERQAAVVVKDSQSLQDFASRCLEFPDFAKQLGTAAQSLVRQQQGAAERTFDLLTSLSGVAHGSRDQRVHDLNAA